MLFKPFAVFSKVCCHFKKYQSIFQQVYYFKIVFIWVEEQGKYRNPFYQGVSRLSYKVTKMFSLNVISSRHITIIHRFFFTCIVTCYCFVNFTFVTQGAIIPSMVGGVGVWSPPDERTTMFAVPSSGCLFGIVFVFPVGGVISKYLGWQYVFFITGL